jgi:hypothetical protein
MLYVDIPTLTELRALAATRADACVSIYLSATALTRDTPGARIQLRDLAKEAIAELRSISFDKRRTAAVAEELEALADDGEFWRYQANSLGVLATADMMRTFRLPNRLTALVEVSDRFQLKPLLRAATSPHEAFVLALSKSAVRLVEVFPDLPPFVVKLKTLPKSAAAAARRASVNERSPRRRIQGSEGQKVLLRQYARKVDAALRGVLSGREPPLLLAATEPLASIFRAVNSYPGLLAHGICGSPDHQTDDELAAAAWPILNDLYARDIERTKAAFETLAAHGRATTDISDAARAATRGAVDTVLVDMEEAAPGTIDEASGRVTLATKSGPRSYDVLEEIVGRALLSGGKVLALSRADIPRGAPLAAVLRYPI